MMDVKPEPGIESLPEFLAAAWQTARPLLGR